MPRTSDDHRTNGDPAALSDHDVSGAAPAVLRQAKTATSGGHLLESGVSYDSDAFAQRGEHKVAVGKTLLIAAVCAIVPLSGNVVASFVTTWTAVGSWLVVPAVHFTRVGVAVRNQTGTAVSLPLYGYCVFAGSDGTTLQADPFRSRWSDTLAPGILQRGVIVFSGHLPAPVLQAALSFTQIFGPGGGSITVRPLNLTPG